jgi:hypothetical protein
MTSPPVPSGIRFALEGIDEITFYKVLRDLMKDPAFSPPLQVIAQPPSAPATQNIQVASLTLVFGPEANDLALAAMQRLKTIMLRYDVQIDSIWTPES